MTEPSLPPELVLAGRAGEGRRSVVYRGCYLDREVAIKVYHQAFIDKYRDKYRVNIGDFEFERNRAVRDVPGLRRYTAEPLAVVGGDGTCRLAFVQEFIDGEALVDLGRRLGGLPDSVLEAGEFIVNNADAAGLHDLDLFYRNILVRQSDGEWLPVLHDFNLMPQHLFPPNPFLSLAYRTGIRKKSHRDRRCIAQWRRFSEACRKGEKFSA